MPFNTALIPPRHLSFDPVSGFFPVGTVPALEAVVSGLGAAVPLGTGMPTLNTGKFSESPMKTRCGFWSGLSLSAMRALGPGLRRRTGTGGLRCLARRGRSLDRGRHRCPVRHGHVDVKRREDALPEIVWKFHLVQGVLALAHCPCSSEYVSRT